MADLFQRDARILAGPLEIKARTAPGVREPLLQVKFDVVKTAGKDPNKGKLAIWNLTEANRARLQEKGLEVIIEAGYLSGVEQIFKGDIDQSTITRDAVNWVVELELGDGSKAIKSARINESARGPQTPGAMLKKAAEALGLDPGNLNDKVSADGARSILKELVSGYVLSGNASEVLDEVASSLGLRFSVQDKRLQFLAPGEALSDPAVKLNAGTGLLGSPSVGEKGVVTAVSLLNGRVKPGRLVELDSVLLSGEYVTKKVQHRGETWGSAWSTTIEMVAA